MNIPVGITLFRLLVIPVIAVFYLLPSYWAHVFSALFFLLAAASDWLDGFLARSLQQATDFGAFLDPVADKLLVTTSLILILFHHPHLVLCIPIVIIIGREIIVLALREWFAELGKRKLVSVNILGKVKTVLQLAAILLLIWNNATIAGFSFYSVGVFLLWQATFLTLWSLYAYARIATKAIF